MIWQQVNSGAAPVAFDAAAPASSPFGVVVPGFAVRCDVQQVDASRWTIALGAAPETFVVFLTGAVPLPGGYGVAVFVAREDAMHFQYVGALGQHRPSSLFKLPTTMMDADQPVSAVLGLALERESELANLGQTQEQPMQQVQAATKVALAERLLEDLYHFVSSYARFIQWDGQAAGSLADIAPGDYVVMPASFVEKWRHRIEAKMRKDASFWS